MNLAQPSTTRTSAAVASIQQAGGKYLIFNLANEEFGFPILKIREIIGLQDITAVPNTPACVRGVINLRGKVIPVIDLRAKFSMEEAEYNERTCIIVVGVTFSANLVLTGVVVDSVSEVLNIASADIEESPDFTEKTEANYIVGMAKVKNKVKILLDVDKVMAGYSVLPSFQTSTSRPQA